MISRKQERVKAYRTAERQRGRQEKNKKREEEEEEEEEEERRRGVRPVRVDRYLGGHLLGGQQLLLRGLALLKQFVSLVLGKSQFLFQLSYVIL